MKEWVGTVVRNEPRGGGYFVLTLALPPRFPKAAGGNFLMLSVNSEPEMLLRRPMAFYDVRRTKSRTEVDVFYAVVGKGTRQLTRTPKGAQLSFLGPIGNQFSLPGAGDRILVVAGGVGIAPFLLWARNLSAAQRKRVRILLGFRNREQLSVTCDFRKASMKPVNAVEGPGGDFRGTVFDLFLREQVEFKPTRVLTCGPPILMDRVSDTCRRLRLPCEVSLEAKMGCGMGVCLSCVTHLGHGARAGGYSLVCQDGPVFQAPL